jgi:hypothetical protein
MPTLPKTFPPEILSDPKKFYDFVMGGIEPDLMTETISTLDEKYGGETEEDRAIRYEKYTFAYQLFDEVVQEFDDAMKKQTKTIIKKMDAKALKKAKEEDDTVLTALSSQISAI